ncbi:MAG: hypothetical protein KDK04_23375, partial [Candidatus Competibacteraceae bacterium]|nr:hypothetical protein [Candidatus Competibacteraceae bacterium]
MRSNNSVLRWCLLATAIVFTIIKIYLTDAQGLIAFAQHIHDDALFVNLANAILSGHWLGDYDQYTLIKGPFYPLWIALCNVVNLPLTYSHQLLYIISCAWAVYALRPLLKGHTIWQFAFYSVLLFNPISYQFDVFPRVIRDGIYTPLTLMLVGFCFGLLLRINTSKTQAILWSLGYGLCLSAFWLTREEGIWILPLLLPMMAYTIWKCIGQSNPVQRIIIALNPIFIVILAI